MAIDRFSFGVRRVPIGTENARDRIRRGGGAERQGVGIGGNTWAGGGEGERAAKKEGGEEEKERRMMRVK